tara:strand:+ start:1574 stop:1774 length:201 start_codon:yes stop_codon:yes gene_type:complete
MKIKNSNEISNMYAHTKHNNSKETDSLPQVEHIVTYTMNGKKISMELMADCPLDAMDKVKAILELR